MPMIKVEQFGGMVPLQDPHLLAQYHAADAVNGNVQSGALACLTSLVPVHTMADPGNRAFFRIPIGRPGIDNIVDSYWLEFPIPDTWVIRSPTPDVDRYYWADGSNPAGYTTRDRVVNYLPLPPVLNPLVANPNSSGLPPGIDIYYVITALSSSGETLKSNEQRVTTPTSAPAATVDVSWSAVEGATGYRLYRGIAAGAEDHYFPMAAGVTSYHDAGVVPGTAGTPPTTNTTDPKLILGIPRPAAAPGVSVSGGTTPVETRGYAYTWVSDFGEEGQPSPPTVFSGNATGTWHITMTAPTPTDMAGRVLTKTRIYRTVTSTQGVAEFFEVIELPITTLVFDDTVPSATVAQNNVMSSTNWLPPPAGLNGLVNMANGMVAGFVGKEIWFCEPYRPHAWPPQYVLTVESDIVGLGVQQQSVVACTVGWTYIATGIRPDAMVLTKVSNLEPCTSMGSIVSSPDGVLYTSVNGLIVVQAGVESNGTANLVRKDEWPKLLYLPELHASYINRSYIAFSAPNDGVFQTDSFQVPTFDHDPGGAFQTIDFTGTHDGAYLSLTDERTAFMKLHSDIAVENVTQDVWTGELLILREDGVVYHFDLRQIYPRLTYRWRSKIYQTPYKENWAAAKVFFDLPPGVAPDGPTYFRFFADGRMVAEKALTKSGEQFRLPSGYKSDMVQFELEGQLVIYNVQIATSARELRNA